MSLRSKRGFTLLEILISLGLLALLTGIVMVSFSKLDSRQALDTATDTVLSVLAEARTLTLAAQDATEYGVNFQTDQIVLFRGASYSAGASTNAATVLNSRVAIGNISLLGGGSSVVFDRLTGATDNAGTIALYLKSATTTTKTVTVSATGVAEKN